MDQFASFIRPIYNFSERFKRPTYNLLKIYKDEFVEFFKYIRIVLDVSTIDTTMLALLRRSSFRF